jgi:hypothetical protein
MNYTQHLKYLKHLILKCLISLLFCLMLTEKAASVPIYLIPLNYVVNDIIANNIFRDAIMPSFNLLLEAFKNDNRVHGLINDQLTKTDRNLENINVQYKKNVDLVKSWTQDTNPDLIALKASLKDEMVLLKRLNLEAKTNLDNYEYEYFINTNSDENTKEQYDKYIKLNSLVTPIKNNAVMMCDKRVKTNNNTYFGLKESSCQSVHNATAYKKKLYEYIVQKQQILEDIMKKVMASNLNTIGEHDARKTMLLELEVLHQEALDDFKLRLNNADIQIQIAKDTELYAAQAIDFGVDSSVMMEGVKKIIGEFTLVGTAKITPYNE